MICENWRSRHPQFQALGSYQTFFDRMMAYCFSNQKIESRDLELRLFRFRGKKMHSEELSRRNQLIDNFSKIKPRLVVVTACKNRANRLRRMYQNITEQVGIGSWCWVIVDNASSDNADSVVRTLDDERVMYLRYNDYTGYASLARNIGLDFVHYAAIKTMVKSNFVYLLDSDDLLENSYSLRELILDANRVIGGYYMTHGFSVCEYYDDMNDIRLDTIPRNTSSFFPKVPSMVDELELGPGIISGMLSTSLLGWLRYPDDFSFEDDTLQQKLMLQLIKNKLKWRSIDYPVTRKFFHKDSMGGENADFESDVVASIGDWHVSGVRALVVKRLYQLRDYYYREGL